MALLRILLCGLTADKSFSHKIIIFKASGSERGVGKVSGRKGKQPLVGVTHYRLSIASVIQVINSSSLGVEAHISKSSEGNNLGMINI